MKSSDYTPRHGAARARSDKGASLRAAIRRPVVGGAIAVAMLGSVGATVALGDPSHDAKTAAPAAESSKTIAVSDAMAADTTRLAEDRRATNVSRSASRELDRLATAAAKKKAEAKKAAEAKRKAAAKKEAAERKRKQEKAKPVSEREFTDAEIKQIQADPAPYGKELAAEYGWGDDQWSCLVSLWIGESNWDYSATNSSSGAYGIPQSLPASKMATAGDDWKTNPITQMEWGMDYIKTSYGDPCGAKAFWDSNDPHWY
ncbi:hypothetical protein [Janibacter sp. YB324]|uniref:aggregation-promoting factor C-terminal-like domain-containing protein n=1 Tax=Janibacter sp. YB324 TaxID=2761047 RepID=UPI001624AF59|nr:hypothetical protein [Janibacter sp. YB324]QNF93559.1 hypothetical protein H7A72_12430 [Janibacter sp. YB324]